MGTPAGGGVSDGLDAIAGDENVGVRADIAGSDVNELAGEDRLGDRGR